MSAATATAPPARSALANAATITARNFRRLTRVPTLLAFATVQPILFVLLFTYGFGGAVHPPGVERYIVRDPESAGLAGIFPVVILVFTSSALVPTATMPGWLEAFANVNPVTVSVDALRALCAGGPTATAVAEALAWNAAILAITVPLASRRYRRATAA